MSPASIRSTDRVIGPAGRPLTRGDLPPTTTKRWVIRRKAEVVAAVRGGLITLDDACRLYRLSVEEFLAWQKAIDRHGIMGLRTTRIQSYRNTDDAQAVGGREARQNLPRLNAF